MAWPSAQPLDLGDVPEDALGEVGGEALDIVGAAPRVDDPRRAGSFWRKSWVLRAMRRRSRSAGPAPSRAVERLGVASGRRHASTVVRMTLKTS